MITPNVKSYFFVAIEDEVAELITNFISERAVADIASAVLVSDNFSSDIEAQLSMSQIVEAVTSDIITPLNSTTDFNPLYMPGEIDIADLFEPGQEDMIRFCAVDGDLFTQQIIKIEQESRRLVTAKCSYEAYDPPAYEDLMSSNITPILN